MIGKYAMYALDFGYRLFKQIRDDEVGGIGAQLAYYLLLSFFPFLIFLVTLVGYADLSIEEMMKLARQVVPEAAMNSVEGILSEVTQGSQALLSIGMIATLWTASRGINAVIKGLNKAYDVEEDRKFWQIRLVSLLSTLVLGVVLLVSLLLLVFGSWIGDQVNRLLNYPSGFERIWSTLQYSIPLVVLIAVFTALYWIAPNRKIRLREAIPGAIFATVGWLLTSLAFSFYVSNFGNFTKTYGSLGGVIILLTWLYLSSIIIIVGGEVNAALKAGRSEPLERRGEKKGLDPQ
ncbi:YihY/virulence factor BrkB family protein [Saccharibacillus alkalitolerans]|uniref:YihY/virulence factor BrkB family protein n=1 Tax=Saccharibacillus alkalitolerans TaxID=2705290 RepID=A0ABX0F1I9_9BACL|nr:YihY/virulence factor BrkB family protein [Saccharibacillus alkalitolerans]NGZ74842.1 YihY/virulence factor BrkB family protein [Saccharibacillus alkalitolerans]